MYYKAYKTELDLNNTQKTKCEKHAGSARYVYNWALEILQDNYNLRKANEEVHVNERRNVGLPDLTKQELKNSRDELYRRFPHYSAIDLHKMLIKLKNEELPWLKEISKWSPQHALMNLEDAYKRFFQFLKTEEYQKKKAKCKNRKKGIFGAPKFKKKNNNDRFTLNEPIYVFEDKVQLPKIGIVRLKEKNYIPTGSPKSATISKKAGRWFISVRYEIEEPKKQEYKNEIISCDLGLKTFAVLSDKEEIKGSKKYNKLQKRIKVQQRKLARQKDFEEKSKRKSKSREKTKVYLQNTYYKASCAQKDIVSKTTTSLARTKPEKYVVIENLNVSGMMKNHNLAGSIGRSCFGEFKRQLEYKCELYGKELILAPTFFPSSKMCSCCGNVKENLKLSERTYICEVCGLKIDRDYNASLNLKDYGICYLKKNTERSSGIEAGVQDIIELKKDRRLHQNSLENFEVPDYETGTKQKVFFIDF